MESMLVLGAPNIDQLDENEVHRCFRRKALQCHPDRLPIDATEEDKVKAKLNWYTIEMARDMLLKYCENPSIMSIQLKKMYKMVVQIHLYFQGSHSNTMFHIIRIDAFHAFYYLSNGF